MQYLKVSICSCRPLQRLLLQLTQNTEKHRVGHGVPLQVTDAAGVIAGLFPFHLLKDQTFPAYN